jgi:hypothetical protein
MLTADDVWPVELIIGGTIVSIGLSLTSLININVKIIILLTFLWSIHSRLHPTFLDEGQRSVNDRPTTRTSARSKPLDYPSRNFWNFFVVACGMTLIYNTASDIQGDFSTGGVEQYVQSMVSLVAGGIGLIFTMSDLYRWLFTRQRVASK